MWKIIIVAGLVTLFLRIYPGFFPSKFSLENYPKLNKYVDYVICLITGEIIYMIALGDVPFSASDYTLFSITILTLMLPVLMMGYNMTLSKTFTLSIFIFSFLYFLFMT